MSLEAFVCSKFELTKLGFSSCPTACVCRTIILVCFGLFWSVLILVKPRRQYSCFKIRIKEIMEMTTTTQAQTSGPSRRNILLQTVGCAAGAAVAFIPVRQAAAKMTQPAASYQDSPKNDQQCDGCSLFQTPNSCRIVDGTVSPSGWCKFWVKKAG